LPCTGASRPRTDSAIIGRMRFLAAVVASSLIAGCSTTTYQISNSELMRLAQLPPAQRGQSARVVQQMTESDLGQEQPEPSETQVVLSPQVYVYENRPVRREG